jgi:hypothetical protein
MKKSKTLTVLSLLAAVLASTGLAVASRQPSIDVPFGRPTFKQKLYYEKMYEKKPFPDATLYYYDNGVYKIVSPGEEHYGVYVVHGHLSDDEYAVDYISLPSPDWGGKTAHHALKFDRKRGTFTQQATWENDPTIPPQYGRFTQDTNTVGNPHDIHWATHGGSYDKRPS